MPGMPEHGTMIHPSAWQDLARQGIKRNEKRARHGNTHQHDTVVEDGPVADGSSLRRVRAEMTTELSRPPVTRRSEQVG